MNIFFTLLVSLLAIWGLHTKKWWLFISMFLLANLINFDYSGNGIILMLIFYLCRNRPALGRALRSVLDSCSLERIYGGP